MGKMFIERSIEIAAPVKKIYDILIDMGQWDKWSPWLIMDPNARVVVSDDSRFYEWNGERVGEGNMQVMDSKDQQWIRYDLMFLKPWKSKADVHFRLTPIDDSNTKVIWDMNSDWPFFLFFMKKSMEAYVGMDYHRGLMMLKDYCENDSIQSKLDFLGDEHIDGFRYVGIRRKCSMDEMSNYMSKDMGSIQASFKDQPELLDGLSFTQYHKWDVVKRQVEYTSAFSVKAGVEAPSDNMVAGNIPTINATRVRHTGPYQHLGNAWSTLYTMQRKKEFKINKSVDPFEIYENMPGEVPEQELRTTIHFPIKD